MDRKEKWGYIKEQLTWFLYEINCGFDLYEDGDFVLQYLSAFIQKLELMFPGTIDEYKKHLHTLNNVEEFKEKIY